MSIYKEHCSYSEGRTGFQQEVHLGKKEVVACPYTDTKTTQDFYTALK